MFGVCPNFPNKTLDQEYSHKLRNCNTENNIYLYIFWPSSLSGIKPLKINLNIISST